MKRIILLAIALFATASIASAGTIKPNGINQKDLYNFLSDTTSIVSELQADHATQKTATDQTETAVEELVDDHATFKTVADDLKTLANNLRTYAADGMKAIGTITVSAGDATKFKTTTTAIYKVAGVYYSKAATDALVFSTAGTINTAGAAGTDHWGAWLVQINAAGTVSTKAVGGGTTDQDYASEAAAIAALPAVDASNVQIGYITVQGLASTAWTATTSNLTVGGGAGNCTARSFYDLPTPPSLPSAVSSSTPATLTAPKPASGPATLTNSTPLSLTQ